MTICRMRVACWIPNAKTTHSEYVMFIAFPVQQCIRERVSLLHYKYVAALLQPRLVVFLLCGTN